MSLYIVDDKNKTVRHYCTSPKVNKAIETLLNEIENLTGSESFPGYTVKIVPEEFDYFRDHT